MNVINHIVWLDLTVTVKFCVADCWLNSYLCGSVVSLCISCSESYRVDGVHFSASDASLLQVSLLHAL